MNLQLLFTAVIVSQVGKIVYGLQCYTCSYSTLMTGNDHVDYTLSQFYKGVKRDESCLLRETNDRNKIPAKTCAPPSPGKASVCATFNGTMTFAVFALEINIKGVFRGCVQVDINTDYAYSKGECYEEHSIPDMFKEVSKQLLGDFDTKVFGGKTCLYADSLGSELYPSGIGINGPKPVRQCYTCSYNKILTGSDIINKATNLVSKVATDNECLMTNDDGVHNIISRTCPDLTSADKIQRCALVRGNITLILAGYAVVYETVSRDCVEVDKLSEEASVNDKCYPEDKESSSLKKIINDYFKDLNVSNFKGESCYYEYNLAAETNPEGIYSNPGIRVVSRSTLTAVMLIASCVLHL